MYHGYINSFSIVLPSLLDFTPSAKPFKRDLNQFKRWEIERNRRKEIKRVKEMKEKEIKRVGAIKREGNKKRRKKKRRKKKELPRNKIALK